jgi:hypothetical protein
MGLPSLLGKRSTTEHLIGCFLTLLKDEEIKIRVSLLQNLDKLA